LAIATGIQLQQKHYQRRKIAANMAHETYYMAEETLPADKRDQPGR
jgi:hypothetical protein